LAKIAEHDEEMLEEEEEDGIGNAKPPEQQSSSETLIPGDSDTPAGQSQQLAALLTLQTNDARKGWLMVRLYNKCGKTRSFQTSFFAQITIFRL
jgi:hypothetical protein